MSDFIDYYLLLQVHYFANDDMIRTAYRKLSQIHHPDKGGGHDKFVQIQEAYETLINKDKKKDYIRTWMNHYIHEADFEFAELKPSLYDITMYHVKEVLMRYLKLISNNSFEDAYDLLSDYNKGKLYKKDFVTWQKLISEVHHLLEYNASLETYNHDKKGLTVTYKVKVKEFNRLMNHVEEDYFKRRMIYENHQWRLLINDIDVRSVIRKYKKILAMNKKNYRKILPKIDENHVTKHVSRKYFLNNCEYERLRYIRYGNPFSIVCIEDKYFDDLYHVLHHNTRQLDCYCDYSKDKILLLLPETNLENTEVVIKKLKESMTRKLNYSFISINDGYSIKELIQKVTRCESEKV
ncbi:hypothetical protein EZV73_24620 [Acidaminobacter sp. JC074]|uniref:DnaJ domain-containing protein n=1 Tax=Acidaminobacter sp. JC074 TaxID=2530199 RepID=UPI001F0F7B7C|nr:DnaJ domain-containing protein [Acidaminobacter sp. JC074]MCH4890786.1 hypothetical protein [Acidaminobacter sp. JC074]